MSEIAVTMPRLGVNDEFATLTEWLVESGTEVHSGQEIAEIETTKETSEIKASADGFLFYELERGTEVKVGETVAVITQSKEFKFEKKDSADQDIKITDKAKALIAKHNIDISRLPAKNIIKEKDVLALINETDTIERSKANDIIVCCGGGLAKMCIDLIRLNKAYNIYGITDKDPGIGPDVMGVPYLGDDNVLDKLHSEGYMTAVNAIGSISIDNKTERFFLRKKMYERIKKYGYFLPTLIHPSAEIAPSAQLGEGTLVFENAVIGSEAIIGDDCIINTGAIVSHDCRIANHVRISPGAVLAGDVKIGENSLIGMGVTVYLGVKIGKNVIIANGQNIVSDVPDNAIIK